MSFPGFLITAINGNNSINQNFIHIVSVEIVY